MAGEGAGDGVAVLSLDTGERGVPNPVRADALCRYPGKVFADALPEVVVATAGDRLTVAVAKELAVHVGVWVALLMVPDKAANQRGRDRLPPDCLTLLTKADRAVCIVEVNWTKCQRTGSAAGGLRVEADQQRVKFWVVAGSAGDVDDLCELSVRQSSAGAGEPPRLGDAGRRVVALRNVPIDGADKAYRGAGGAIGVPHYGRDLPARMRDCNSSHNQICGIGERANATLKPGASYADCAAAHSKPPR